MSGPAWLVAFSLIGIGGLAHAAGFPVGAAAASTLLIWAGPAQVIFFAGAASKMAWPLVALSVSLSSVRMLPMGIAVLPLLRGKGTRLWVQLLAAQCISVTVWAETLRRVPMMERETRLPFYFGFALACIATTTLATVLGFGLIERLPVPLAAGLLFLSPVYFVSALARNARDQADWLALLLGLVLAPFATMLFGSGVDLLVLGLSGGTLAWYFGYRRKWRLWP